MCIAHILLNKFWAEISFSSIQCDKNVLNFCGIWTLIIVKVEDPRNLILHVLNIDKRWKPSNHEWEWSAQRSAGIKQTLACWSERNGSWPMRWEPRKNASIIITALTLWVVKVSPITIINRTHIMGRVKIVRVKRNNPLNTWRRRSGAGFR